MVAIFICGLKFHESIYQYLQNLWNLSTRKKPTIYGILHIYKFIPVVLFAKYTYNMSTATSSGPSDHESQLLAQGKGSHANHVTL